MDWFTLLLIFIFFVLPLIQQIAEARRKGQQPPELPQREESEEWEEWEAWEQVEAPTERRREVPSQPAERPTVEPRPQEGSWSSHWGEWPEQVVAREPKEEVQPLHVEPMRRSDAARPERAQPVIREERQLFEREVPKAARLSDPRRLHAALRVAEVGDGLTPGRRARSAFAGVLGDPAGLRRAIVLAEVLGAPRALRELREDGG